MSSRDKKTVGEGIFLWNGGEVDEESIKKYIETQRKEEKDDSSAVFKVCDVSIVV